MEITEFLACATMAEACRRWCCRYPGLFGIGPTETSSAEQLLELMKWGPKGEGEGDPGQEAQLACEIWNRGPWQPSEQAFIPSALLELLGVDKPGGVAFRYYATRDLRRRYRLFATARLARTIRRISDSLVSLASSHDGRVSLDPSDPLSIQNLERAVLEEEFPGQHRELGVKPGFLVETLILTELLTPAPDGLDAILDHERLHADGLLGNLFGFPSEIEGFDGLFRGTGLMLAENLRCSIKSREGIDWRGMAPRLVSGRTILAVGAFGSGKSLLSLQFAIEVAKRGGMALIMPLEQTVGECLYSLEALGVQTSEDRFAVTQTVPDALRMIKENGFGRGLLAFIPSGGQNYLATLELTKQNLALLDRFPLRLLVLDPINAAEGGSPLTDLGERRRQTLELLQEAKRRQVNIWITCERQQAAEIEQMTAFEENVADTVLALGTESGPQSQRRYIEVRKSRYQPERPGKHPLRIKSRRGIRIYPLSTEIAAPVKRAPGGREGRSIPSGIRNLDEWLGDGATQAGDLVVMHGPSGTSKTLAALSFGLAERPGGRTLFVADHEEDRLYAHMSALGYKGDLSALAHRAEFLPVLSGYVEPGELLERIEVRLEEARARHAEFDRAVLGNLSRWTVAMPLLKEDPLFGVALTGLLRKFGVSAAIVLGGAEREGDAGLRGLLIDRADTVLAFELLTIRGERRQSLTIQKTKTMTHRKEPCELVVDGSGVRVEGNLSLWRVAPDGSAQPVPVQLCLHHETQNHRALNREFKSLLQSTLTPDVRLVTQTRNFDEGLMGLAGSSAVDVLQILQLDEFQIPPAFAEPKGREWLMRFRLEDHPQLLADCLPHYRERVLRTSDMTFAAVPYYENNSWLAYHRGRFAEVSSSFPSTWFELAEMAAGWKRNGLFFACHATESNRFESYNCLFLEILLSQPKARDEAEDGCPLAVWCEGEQAVEAAYCLHRLCWASHSHLLKAIQRDDRVRTVGADYRSAVVWRHWYNTLNQMLTDMPEEDRQQIAVRPLFGNRTTSGEWYLAIPTHSSAPGIGASIIEYLVSVERESSRVHRGVGMPTRQSFYGSAERPRTNTRVSPFFDLPPGLDLTALLSTAFRRSDVPCYLRLSETLSAHLAHVLSFAEGSGLKKRIREVIKSLHEEVVQLQGHAQCHGRQCGMRRR